MEREVIQRSLPNASTSQQQSIRQRENEVIRSRSDYGKSKLGYVSHKPSGSIADRCTSSFGKFGDLNFLLSVHLPYSIYLWQQTKERDYRSRDARIKDLENAHMQQARVMQKLQADNKKIGAYKSTVKFQEKVIAKLENLLESKMKENASGAAGGMQLARLKRQVEHLSRRNKELEKDGASNSRVTTAAEGARLF